MDLDIIQQQLIHMLDGSQAHITFPKAIENFPLDKINTHIDGVPYTPWEIVEHMRITQLDILEYLKSPNYKELKFPREYWPAKGKVATADDWNASVKHINIDLQALKEIAVNRDTDFTSPLVHNANHNIFREILIMGNHNSYHTGQILIFKRALHIY